MTRIWIYLFIQTLLCASCSKDYKFENNWYECIQSNYTEKELNLIELVDSLELNLMKDSLLFLNHDSAYIRLVNKLSDHNFKSQFSLTTEKLFFDLFTSRVSWSCSKVSDLDSTGFSSSKLLKFVTYTDRVSGEVENATYFQGMLEILDLDDLNHPLYQLLILKAFFERHVEPRPASCGGPVLFQRCANCRGDFPVDSIQFHDTLYFYLNSYSHVDINGFKKNLEQVPGLVSESLINDRYNSSNEFAIADIGVSKVSALFIIIEASDETSYNSMCDLYEQIELGFEIAYDELAQSKFRKTYEELENQHQESIREVYPVYLNLD